MEVGKTKQPSSSGGAIIMLDASICSGALLAKMHVHVVHTVDTGYDSIRVYTSEIHRTKMQSPHCKFVPGQYQNIKIHVGHI